MPSDLSEYIETIRVIDTHSHMQSDIQWEESGPRDVLVDLFGMYSRDDLVIAGAAPAAVERLLDGTDPDIEGRLDAVADAWRAMQFTGYGEAVRSSHHSSMAWKRSVAQPHGKRNPCLRRSVPPRVLYTSYEIERISTIFRLIAAFGCRKALQRLQTSTCTISHGLVSAGET